MTEEWRIAPSFPDYEASSLGRIRRRTGPPKSPKGGFVARPGHVLKPSIQKRTGYLKLTLIDPEGRRVDAHVHRLVCEAFHGQCPPRMECAHNDGSRTNNVSGNLRWATEQENQLDRFLHGTAIVGEQVKNSKLTAAAVIEIRRRRAQGERCVDLGPEFGVSQYAISKVCLGKNWRHV